MWKIGTHWIELWKLSDFVFLLFAAAWISSLLLGLVFLMKRFLDPRLHMGEISRMLKLLLLYMLFFMPLTAAVILYKSTYVYVGPFDPINNPVTMIVQVRSISSSTAYGNHWVFALLLSIWFVGFLFMRLYHWVQSTIAVRQLKAAAFPCTDPITLSMADALMQELKIKKNISIWISSMADSPFIIGTRKPKIYLPDTAFEPEKEWLILKHELTHCQKRDPLYRKLLTFLCEIYWFDPLVFIFSKYFIAVNEMACDETVLKRKTKRIRFLYGSMLVGMGQEHPQLSNTASLTRQAESQIEKRLKNILRNHTDSSHAALLTLIFVLCSLLISVAASFGSSRIQEFCSDRISAQVDGVMDFGNTLTEYSEPLEASEAPLPSSGVQLSLENGYDNPLDLLVTGAVSLGKVTLTARNDFLFYVQTDALDAAFRIGYITPSGTKIYVESSEGQVYHEFRISEAGTYEFFAEALSSDTISLSGYVDIYSHN